ncbi:MAG: hypothetical protein HY297_00930 [Thaumarchaeota archaeon]|nr:hypothetical protein [Nitrososphaerota archaeon]
MGLLFAVAYWERGSREASARAARFGLLLVLAAAAFNEVWHRVLLFGNPLPEPFPVEPPHVILAVGLMVCGAAALLRPATTRPSGALEKACVSLLAGSMWLILAGSFFYLGGAYGNSASYFLAVAIASFSSSLFLRYSSLFTGGFGYASLAYGWFLGVNYLFFVGLSDGLPLGILPVLAVDYVLTRRPAGRALSKWAASIALALLYGLVYYPLLPLDETLAPNLFLVVSGAGVAAESLVERLVRGGWLRLVGGVGVRK